MGTQALRQWQRSHQKTILSHPTAVLSVSGVLVGLISAWHFSAAFEGVIFVVGAVGLFELAIIDAAVFLVPRRVLYPFVGLVLSSLVIEALVQMSPSVVYVPLVAAALSVGALYLLSRFGRDAMGMGDVRLGGLFALVVGVFGAKVVLVAWWLTFVFAGVVGIWKKKASAHLVRHIAFAPPMALGAVVAMCLGAQGARWWSLHG